MHQIKDIINHWRGVTGQTIMFLLNIFTRCNHNSGFMFRLLYWLRYYFHNFLTLKNGHFSCKRIAGVCDDIYILRQCWQILWRRWGWWQTVIVSVLFLIRSSDQMFCGGNIIGREQQRARSLIKMMRRNMILMIRVMMIVMITMIRFYLIPIRY